MNRLSISNFGPVKDAILELRSINLLIGEQSIGKSTIAKLIAIFTDNVSLSTIAGNGIKTWKGRLKFYDLDIFCDDEYQIEYEFEDKVFHLIMTVTKSRVSTRLFERGVLIKDKKLVSQKIIYMRSIFKRKEILEALYNELVKSKGEEEDLGYLALSLQSILESSLYVPAERIAYSIIDNLRSAFSLIGDSSSFTYRRFMVGFDKAKSRLQQYDSPLLKIKYLNEENGQFFVDYSSQKKYHLFNASSGIQSALPLLVVLEDAKNRDYSSIVIEEPETNLFPNTQVAVLKLILEKARANGRIVTITTHSPYLLSAFNNYLYAGIVAKNVDKAQVKDLDDILPSKYRLDAADCSVYSIGQSINSDGNYCSSLITDFGMIDSNSLDSISFDMSNEFEALQDFYLKNSR